MLASKALTRQFCRTRFARCKLQCYHCPLMAQSRPSALTYFCPKMSLPDRQLLTLIRLSALTFIVGFRRSQPQPTVINLTPGCSGFS